MTFVQPFKSSPDSKMTMKFGSRSFASRFGQDRYALLMIPKIEKEVVEWFRGYQWQGEFRHCMMIHSINQIETSTTLYRRQN